MSQNFQDNKRHLIIKKNKQKIENKTTTIAMQEGNGQQNLRITVKKKEEIEITCSICSDTENGLYTVIRRCNHIFHSICLQTWINQKRLEGKPITCHMCNYEFFKMNVKNGLLNNSILKMIDFALLEVSVTG